MHLHQEVDYVMVKVLKEFHESLPRLKLLMSVSFLFQTCKAQP